MKKLSFLVLFFVTPTIKASDLCTNWGAMSVCMPIASGVDAAFGYDFKGHRSQGLAETPFAKWNLTQTSVLVFKAGGITTEKGKGAPFIGVDYELKGIQNPIPGITTINPGVYGGHDFHENEWFYGLKASIPVFSMNQ